jgi:pyruvate kinase
MRRRKTRFVVTLGPSTMTIEALRRLRARGVDFVRTNMSHSSLEDLERAISLARRVGIPFVIDTEGSQVRTGDMKAPRASFAETREVILTAGPEEGGAGTLVLRPPAVLGQLRPGDLVHVDFDTLVLRVTDASSAWEGRVAARVITGGMAGRNKAVVIDPAFKRKLDLPALSEKDLRSIEIGLREGIEHIAVSFVRSGAAVDQARRATHGRMAIISKIECIDALERLDEIIERSDWLLIDRGDLSKEIPIERIPFAQKAIISRARSRGRGVFVATNLLETMIGSRKPTRAEVQDVVNTIADGAAGLTLAAETAIGKHPIECVNMLDRLVAHAEAVLERVGCPQGQEAPFVEGLASCGYLTEPDGWSALAVPHGGRLVDRTIDEAPPRQRLERLPRVVLDRRRQMDLDQIAVGTYSPLEGFMGSRDLESVLADMRLADGTVWPMPVLLDVAPSDVRGLGTGEEIALTDEAGAVLGLMELAEVFRTDHEMLARRLHGTCDPRHPGAREVLAMRPLLLAGRVTLLRRPSSRTAEYELSPRQTRRLFAERGWVKVLGVHTREVVRRADELLQLAAMEHISCDGLFVHPVVGDERPGDIRPWYIVKSYERMTERVYPRDRVLLGGLPTWTRDAGARETLFWALCRLNHGCSHYLAAGERDEAARRREREVIERFPELGIAILTADEVPLPRGDEAVAFEGEHGVPVIVDAPAAWRMLEQGKMPPARVMRREISRMILDAIREGREVFVPAGERA